MRERIEELGLALDAAVAPFLEAATGGRSERAARLLALGKAYVDFALAEPHAYRLMFELGQPDPDGHPELREAELRAWAPLREAVRAAVEAGRLRGDVDLLAHGFWLGTAGEPFTVWHYAALLGLTLLAARSVARSATRIRPARCPSAR